MDGGHAAVGNERAKHEGTTAVALGRFYWVIEGALAGCSRPGAVHPRPDVAGGALEEDLRWLRERGIGALLSLTEEPLEPGAAERAGIAALHLAVPDFHPPTADQMNEALRFLDAQRGAGRAVAVHCLAGQGRTGTVLAAYLIRGGIDADAAVAMVRRACPGAIESAAQTKALAEYAARRGWFV